MALQQTVCKLVVETLHVSKLVVKTSEPPSNKEAEVVAVESEFSKGVFYASRVGKDAHVGVLAGLRSTTICKLDVDGISIFETLYPVNFLSPYAVQPCKSADQLTCILFLCRLWIRLLYSVSISFSFRLCLALVCWIPASPGRKKRTPNAWSPTVHFEGCQCSLIGLQVLRFPGDFVMRRSVPKHVFVSLVDVLSL